jgi:hypothetical protein
MLLQSSTIILILHLVLCTIPNFTMCQDHVHQHGHGHNHLHHMHDEGDAQEGLTLAEKNRDFWEYVTFYTTHFLPNQSR